MFTRFISAIISATLLAGCAGQGFYLVAWDPSNPYSHVSVEVPATIDYNRSQVFWVDGRPVRKLYAPPGVNLNYWCIPSDCYRDQLGWYIYQPL